jgi:hypothetical protein
MPTLPVLKSGQIVQYPFKRSLQCDVDTVVFLDGSEQRSAKSRPLHQWSIQLGLIDEQELNEIVSFFEQQRGEAGRFEFTDPADGVQYDNCSLELGVINSHFNSPGRAMTVLVIRENPN